MLRPLVLVALTSQLVAQNLITNGTFETRTYAPWVLFNGTVSTVASVAVGKDVDGALLVPANSSVDMRQTAYLPRDGYYRLRFAALQGPASSRGSANIQVSSLGVGTSWGSTSWDHQDLVSRPVMLKEGTWLVTLTATTNSVPMHIDDIALEAVTEDGLVLSTSERALLVTNSTSQQVAYLVFTSPFILSTPKSMVLPFTGSLWLDDSKGILLIGNGIANANSTALFWTLPAEASNLKITLGWQVLNLFTLRVGPLTTHTLR